MAPISQTGSAMAETGNRGLLLAVAGIALLMASIWAAYRAPVPLGANAPLDRFSAGRALTILRQLVGDGVPHPIGSAADAQLRNSIVERLQALGYTTELQSGFACNDGACGNPVNIIAGLPASAGDQPLEGTILLAAHYDSVPAGPGASDDGAGVAAVLEIARILSTRPRTRHPIAILLTDGEEAALLGAALFVREHPLSRHIKAVVNLEARGTSGLSLMFETGSANAWLMHLYAAAVARPVTNSLFYVVYKLLPNDTDFTLFKAAGYQGFNFAFIGNVGRYHTPLDDVAHADAGSIQHQGDNALAVFTALAQAPVLESTPTESVFLDVLSRTLVAWRSGFAVPAALLASAVLLAETFVLLRRRVVTGREILWGAAGVFGVLLSGGALGTLLLVAEIASGKVPPLGGASWIAQPVPLHCAAASIAFLAAGGIAAVLARRAGFWGFWLAGSLFTGGLCLASAVFVPGASFLALLPTLAAALAALPFTCMTAGGRAPPAWSRDGAALAPLWVRFAVALPLLRFLYMALGGLAWPVSTLLICVGSIGLLPLLARATGRARQAVMALNGVIAVGGALITLSLPTYSADWPQRVNLEYWLDADAGQAHILAQCSATRLPPALAAAARFDPIPHPPYPGSTLRAFYAPAPILELAAPQLSLVSQAAGRWTLHLRSPRGAPAAWVIFPADADVTDAEFSTAAGPVRTRLSKLTGGATELDLASLPPAGVDFHIDAASEHPLAVQVFDESYSLAGSPALAQARPSTATSSQDGDVTVVHRTVTLDPAAGR